MKKLFVFGVLLFFLSGLNAQELIEKDGKYYSDGILYNGVFKEKNDSGVVVSERNFRDGLEHGVSLYYYDSGTKHEQRTYNMGYKDGTWLTWNKKGIKTAEANYINDLKHGRWIIFDDAGNKRYEMYYHKGEKVSTWYMWDENGKLISEKKF